jgi:hypothetical protein
MYREITIKTKTTGPYQGVANPVSYETKSGSSDFTMRALLKSFRMSSTATMQHKSGKMVSSFRKS